MRENKRNQNFFLLFHNLFIKIINSFAFSNLSLLIFEYSFIFSEKFQFFIFYVLIILLLLKNGSEEIFILLVSLILFFEIFIFLLMYMKLSKPYGKLLFSFNNLKSLFINLFFYSLKLDGFFTLLIILLNRISPFKTSLFCAFFFIFKIFKSIVYFDYKLHLFL